MQTVEHKEGCWYPGAMVEALRYAKAWPNCCTQCTGWGGFVWHDLDSGYQEFDPCPKCLEKGTCPRCGGGVISEAYWDAGHYTNCDNCGFIEATTPGAPFFEECSCFPMFDEFGDLPF